MADDDNLSWEGLWPYGYEPWEDAPDDDVRAAGGCAYCDETEVREWPDPFGGLPCCEQCFLLLIGDDEDSKPWRCGTGG